MPRDVPLLEDIVDAARRIERFIQGSNREEFVADEKGVGATIHQIMIIGEATKGLSIDFCKAHPAIAWSKIARMRDKLIHHYNEIDEIEVWNAVSISVPQLLAYILPLLPTDDADEAHKD